MTEKHLLEPPVNYIANTDEGANVRSMEISSTGSAFQLFREQAIQARAPAAFPSAILIHAPYVNLTALLAAVVVFVVVLFCIFGSLTQLVSVQGILVPEKSSLKILSPKVGVLVKNYVTEGQMVSKGSPLFSVTAEEYGSDNAAMLARQSALIRQRLDTIATNKTLAEATSAALQASLKQDIAVAVSQRQILANSIEVQQRSIDLDQRIADRKTSLHDQGVATLDDIERVQLALLSDRRELLNLMNSEQTIIAKIADDQYRLDDEPLQLSVKLADLDEQIKSAEIDLAKTEMQREITVVSPVDSIVTSDIAYAGQNVSLENPLVVLTPQHSKLIAQLLVPSQGIGFIKKGSAVSIKYDAFPYETFGYFSGKVISISSVALSRDELQTLKVPVKSDQPYFNVLAYIDLQSVETYGHQIPLAAGSTFSAVVAGETRYIWQWILNPLLSIKGRAFAGGTSGGD